MKRLVTLCMLGLGLTVANADVNLITDRSDFHTKWLVEDFQKDTGVNVNVLFTEKGLVERAKVETDAVVFTNDALNIVKLNQSGVLEDINVKTDLFHTDRYVVTAGRIRGFFVEKGTDVPVSYDDIVSSKFQHKVCIRPLNHNYNLTMLSVLIDRKGVDYTRKFLDNLKGNLAITPESNDRGQVKAIYEGECTVSIGNSYYMGLMQKDPVQVQWAKKVEFVTPKDPIWLYSAVGITKDTADNRKFVEYITSKKVQDKIHTNDFEFTNLKEINYDLEKIAENKETAYNLVMEN